jgi:transposase-like protein
MSRRGERDRGKERFWRRMVRLWRRSGLTIRGFCDDHGLSEPSFYSWRRVLAARDHGTARVKTARSVRARRQSGNGRCQKAPAFVPVHVVPPLAADGSSLEVVLSNQRVLRVAPGFDAATLRQLLAVMEEPSC